MLDEAEMLTAREVWTLLGVGKTKFYDLQGKGVIKKVIVPQLSVARYRRTDLVAIGLTKEERRVRYFERQRQAAKH